MKKRWRREHLFLRLSVMAWTAVLLIVLIVGWVSSYAIDLRIQALLGDTKMFAFQSMGGRAMVVLFFLREPGEKIDRGFTKWLTIHFAPPSRFPTMQLGVNSITYDHLLARRPFLWNSDEQKIYFMQFWFWRHGCAMSDPSNVVHASPAFTVYHIQFPYWFLVLVNILLLLFQWRLFYRLKRRERGRRGLCVTCGYDLRAHAAGGRCPECGGVIGEGRGGVIKN